MPPPNLTKTAALAIAHAWTASIIRGALDNGDGDDLGTANDEDYRRVHAAILRLAADHERKANSR